MLQRKPLVVARRLLRLIIFLSTAFAKKNTQRLRAECSQTYSNQETALTDYLSIEVLSGTVLLQ